MKAITRNCGKLLIASLRYNPSLPDNLEGVIIRQEPVFMPGFQNFFHRVFLWLALRWINWQWWWLWKPKTGKRRKTAFHFFAWLIAFSPIIVLAICFYIIKVEIWQVKNLGERRQRVSTTILDRHGEVLYRVYEDENRIVIPLNEVSPYLQKATVAIEDQSFYTHPGFSLRGISRALVANFKGQSIQGGSTLTQQLVKMTLLSPERTMERKIKELLLAVIVDVVYSKNEILEMYFNQIPYGGSTYGAQQAAQRYFGKDAADLSLAESALLAGLPAAPTIYSPFGPHPELAEARKAEVLRRMVEDGYISQAEADEAKMEKLVFRQDITNIKAPHFVMYVRSILAERYGEDFISRGGLVVKTTLDLELQQLSENAVASEVAKLKNLRVSNGAALVTNPQTGEILSMVGSVNYFDFEHDGQVNVTLRPRQPGSSIKPLNYATAMQLGLLTPASKIMDEPITYQSQGSPPYSPVNYDGKFHGSVSVRESLASSYNIPAVKTLAMVGIDRFIDQAEAMGITTWQDRKRFGLSLTLGGGEVLMTDMAKAYSAFPNYGYTVDLNPFLEIVNYKGEKLYRNRCALEGIGCLRNQVLSPGVAYQISSILADNAARTPAFGPRSVLFIPNQEVAVKTGTTNNLRDNWTFGYTTDRLVATWVGNNDNTTMSNIASGITGASPIWNNIMRAILDDQNPHKFSLPTGLYQAEVCDKGVKRIEYFPVPTQNQPCTKNPAATPGATPVASPKASLQPNTQPNPRNPRR